MSLFNSIFGSEYYLTEDSVGDDTDQPEEYSMDDNESGHNNEESDDNAGGEPEAQSDEEGEEEQPEEYSIDDNEESEDNNDESNNEESEENNEDSEEGEEEQPEEYSMDDNEESEGDDSGDNTSDDQNDDNDSGDDNSDTDSDDQNDPNSKLKALQKSIFDQLSPEEQRAKIKELKKLYTDVYQKCQRIITMISTVDKIPSQAKIYDYVMNSLTDLQKYIKDYLEDIFDSKTYIDNMTELQKYMTVLDTVNGVFEEMRKNTEEEAK